MIKLGIEDFAWGGVAVPILLIIAQVLVNIAFSAGVYVASKDRKTALAPGVIWSIATLFGGVLVAVAYWLVHHSNLSNINQH